MLRESEAGAETKDLCRRHGISEFMIEEFRRSPTRSCNLVGLGRSTWRYKARRPADEKVRQRLRELAQKRTRFGYRRLAIFLRREGHVVNHKKVFRLYRAEGLTLPRKRRPYTMRG